MTLVTDKPLSANGYPLIARGRLWLHDGRGSVRLKAPNSALQMTPQSLEDLEDNLRSPCNPLLPPCE